jgi:APA family basic amino acid/polyamine antiporter
MSATEFIGIIAIALSGAFWAYDGWGTVAYLAGEVKEPSKTIPRAILLGAFIFISLYMIVNLAYLYILPVGTMANVEGDRVASAMATEVIGGLGGGLIAALIMVSTFDATNSTILTNARCYFAMAKANLFWRKTGTVHPRFKTPYISLMMQGAWAIVLLFSGSFWTIIDMYVFVNWIVYILMGTGVFIMRRRHPNAERSFRVPGYPIVPGLFVAFAITFVVLTLVTDIQNFQAGKQEFLNSVMGLILVLSGLPLYYLWKYQNRYQNTGQPELPE